jgi:hypothetical protein
MTARSCQGVGVFVPDDHVVEDFGIFVILGLFRLDLHSVLRALPVDAVFVLVFEEIPPACLVRQHALIALVPLAGVGFEGRLGFGIEGKDAVLRVALDAVVTEKEERRLVVVDIVEGADVAATGGL